MEAPKYIAVLAFLLMGVSGVSQDIHPQKAGALAAVIPWNPADAITFAEQASDALERARVAYRGGKYVEAFDEFSKAATAGNPEAMSYVGFMYGEGRGVTQDYQQALKWLKKAAAADSTDGMLNLGILYHAGHGIPRDYQQAREWFEKAAIKGNATAMSYMGTLYLQGEGVTQDYQQARQWSEKAAAAGNADAMVNLGYLYDHGYGVKRDYQQARQWYEKAAAAGNARPWTTWAHCTTTGAAYSRTSTRRGNGSPKEQKPGFRTPCTTSLCYTNLALE